MTFRFLSPVVAAVALATFGLPASAALKPGDAAPDFTTQAALGGKEFKFALADAPRAHQMVLESGALGKLVLVP